MAPQCLHFQKVTQSREPQVPENPSGGLCKVQPPSPDPSCPDLLNRNLPAWNLRVCAFKNSPFGSSDPGEEEHRPVVLALLSDKDVGLSCQAHEWNTRGRGCREDSGATLCSYCAEDNLTPCTFVSCHPDSGTVPSLCTPGALSRVLLSFPHRLRRNADGPGHHDPVHHSLLHRLSDLPAAALPPQAGREIRFNLHHPAPVL